MYSPRLVCFALAACFGTFACSSGPEGNPLEGVPSDSTGGAPGKADGYGTLSSYVVVPNLSNSTVTLLDSASGDVLNTITADDVGFEFAPIYATHLVASGLVTVSDRDNSRVLFFDSRTFGFLGFVTASEGLFHTWPSASRDTVYVVADVDNKLDAIDVTRTENGIYVNRRVFDIDAAVPGGKPHDVVADNDFVYVTVQLAEQGIDKVLKIEQSSLALIDQLEVSVDAHLGIPLETPYLLIPEQTDGELNYVDRDSFEILATVGGVAGSHGVFWNRQATRVFLSNFLSSGSDGVYEVVTPSYVLEPSLRSTTSVEAAKPHNLTIDFDSGLLFATHTGPNNNGELNNSVSVIDISGEPNAVRSVEVGLNPLGITLVKNR